MRHLLHFVEVHWGDLVSLLVLGVGISLVACGPHEKAQQLGEALSAAALVGLKLRGTPSKSAVNGDQKNGNEMTASSGDARESATR